MLHAKIECSGDWLYTPLWGKRNFTEIKKKNEQENENQQSSLKL